MKPSLFSKLFGKIPTRLTVAKLSGGIFLGSFIGTAVTLPPVDPIKETQAEESDVTISEEAEEITSTQEETLQTEKVKVETKQEIIETEPVTEEPTIEIQEEPDQAPVYAPEPQYEPEPTPAPEPTPVPTTPSYNCSSNSYNCSDFSSWPAAQGVYQYCLDTVGWDVHDLDRDNDGSACDDLKD